MSLPVGVVTLAERYGGVTVTREIFEAMVAEVAALVDRFVRRARRRWRDGRVHCSAPRAR